MKTEKNILLQRVIAVEKRGERYWQDLLAIECSPQERAYFEQQRDEIMATLASLRQDAVNLVTTLRNIEIRIDQNHQDLKRKIRETRKSKLRHR